jgi:hypothetical protein
MNDLFPDATPAAEMEKLADGASGQERKILRITNCLGLAGVAGEISVRWSHSKCSAATATLGSQLPTETLTRGSRQPRFRPCGHAFRGPVRGRLAVNPTPIRRHVGTSLPPQTPCSSASESIRSYRVRRFSDDRFETPAVVKQRCFSLLVS